MKRLSILLVFSIMYLNGYSQTDIALPQEIKDSLKVEQTKMFNGFCNGDTELFLKQAGEDYLSINADGTYLNKSKTIEIIPKFKGSTYKLIEQTDRFYGNVAVSTGRTK